MHTYIKFSKFANLRAKGENKLHENSTKVYP